MDLTSKRKFKRHFPPRKIIQKSYEISQENPQYTIDDVLHDFMKDVYSVCKPKVNTEDPSWSNHNDYTETYQSLNEMFDSASKVLDSPYFRKLWGL